MKGSVGEEIAPSGDSPAKPLPVLATSLSSISPEPAALLEILGEPILHRMVEVLRRGNVELIYLVVDEIFRGSEVVDRLSRERIRILSAPAKGLGTLIETAVKRCSEHAVENVVLMGASAYLELDVKDFLQVHQAGNQRVTLAYDESGSLPVALLSSAEPELAPSLFERNLLFPQPTARYLHRGYVNRLKNAQDLRLLAQDGLQHRCRIRPNGEEVRPGVWVASTAYLHPSARLVGPAYLGPNSRVRSGAVVSDCSTVERDCIVERGTLVKDSSILGGTYVGVGLDVSHSVVRQSRLVDVQRNVGIDIVDSLIGASSLSPKRLVPALWASMANKGGSSLRTMRGKFRTLVPKRDPAPVAAPARLTYVPAESWGTMKQLSRTDSNSI